MNEQPDLKQKLLNLYVSLIGDFAKILSLQLAKIHLAMQIKLTAIFFTNYIKIIKSYKRFRQSREDKYRIYRTFKEV